MQPSDNIYTVVAYVPQPELINYANDLHNMSQGRATYQMEFSRYQDWGSDDDTGGGVGVPSPLKPVPPTLSAGAAAEPPFDEPS
jgi:translation elongation factor EF-G